MPSSKKHMELMFGARDWGLVQYGTRSGVGSTLNSTRAIRKDLPNILRDYGVKTLNDAGCGDLLWISQVPMLDVVYNGYDIHPLNGVEAARLGQMRARAARFYQLDFVNEDMSECDMVMCRDTLSHLSNVDVMAAIDRFARVSPLLMATSSPAAFNRRMAVSGGFDPINLAGAPFLLGTPETLVEEPEWNRFIGVWRL